MGESMEDKEFVDTVEELGIEYFFGLFHDAFFHFLVLIVLCGLLESERDVLGDAARAHVAGHHDDRIAKVDFPP